MRFHVAPNTFKNLFVCVKNASVFVLPCCQTSHVDVATSANPDSRRDTCVDYCMVLVIQTRAYEPKIHLNTFVFFYSFKAVAVGYNKRIFKMLHAVDDDDYILFRFGGRAFYRAGCQFPFAYTIVL